MSNARVTFEVSTIVDAIQRAARVAPTKGSALDKAAGIVIQGDPHALGDPVTVMATDLDVSFRTTITALEMGTEPFMWRLPSTLLNGIMGTLPIGGGNQMLMLQHNDEVRFRAGKTKAKLNMIMGNYPLFAPFDASAHKPATGLAGRLKQVAWAVNNRSVDILSGVHLDGEFLYGCDRTRLALVPCVVPVDRPVTAQLTAVASTLRNTSDVGVRATETKLELSPDNHTQVTSRLIEGDYPNVRRIMRDDYTGEVTIQSDVISSVIDRMMVLAKNERSTATSIIIGDGHMEMSMDSADVGTVVDEFEVVGGETGEPFRMKFDSASLRSAINASGRPQFKIRYGAPSMGNKKPIELSDDTDFRAILMPMAPEG